MTPSPTDTAASSAIIDRHDRFMSINYGRLPIAMVRGQGSTLEDADGTRYTDLFAGFGAGLLGHCHPDLVAAVTEQANTLWHVGNLLHTEPQTRLAEAIATHGFGGKSFFCHSGADANEAAIKLARLHGRARPGRNGPRYKVISAKQSFHGRSFATMAATGQPKVSEPFHPLAPGFVHVEFNDLNEIEAAIDDETAAVLLEPIQGEGGVRVPTDDYLPRLRELCDAHELLLMMDEVWTGCGRTGRYFAHQHWNIEPDVMTLAKGVGGGLPVGVCCAKPEVAELFDWRKYGAAVHATTLGGNCLSMAVAAKLFEVIERDGLVQRAAQLGEHVIQRLCALAQDCPAVTNVRGKGLFIGAQLDAEAKGASFEKASEVMERCLKRGVLVNIAQGTVLRVAPALTIEQDDLDRALDVVEEAIRG
ncbi:MAG: aspartate aminotransferase family protein [Phycisphaeraceae bacterium]